MILNLKRYISLLLVLMLLIGIVPTAYAAEPDTGSVVQEDTTEPTEPTDPLGNEVLSAPAALSAAGDYAVMSIASTQNSIMLFDYADNGNYTTVLNSQVACAYKPNGSGTTRTAYIKNLGWHFARYWKRICPWNCVGGTFWQQAGLDGPKRSLLRKLRPMSMK